MLDPAERTLASRDDITVIAYTSFELSQDSRQLRTHTTLSPRDKK
jgi:hypothetical protein